MRPPGIWTSILIVLAFAVALNFFIRVAGSEDALSTGIVVEFLLTQSYWLSITLFLSATLLVYMGFRVWGFVRVLKMPGVVDFWKVVAGHPDAAYEWFVQSDAWAVQPHPLDKEYKKEFPIKEWAGPFDLWVPSCGKRVCIFGKAGRYENTREQFIQRIAPTESKDTKADEGIESSDKTGKPDPASASRGKTLLEKAEDAPIAFRILIDSIQLRLERDYAQVLLLPKWSAFQMVATVAGCVALATRIHFDVPEDQRTPLELAMRKVLARRFPESEQAYEDCYRFVTDSIIDIPRSERGKYFFVLVAVWVYAAVSEGRKIEQEEWIVGRLAEAYQEETIGFWKIIDRGVTG